MTHRTSDQRQAIRDLFHQRDFALLWAGQLFSQIGDQSLLVAAITLITTLSVSPLALLIPAIAVALPQVLFGLLGGVVADRWGRKSVMIVSDLLRALLVLAVLLVRSPGTLWILYLAAAGLTVVGIFFYPARNATIPNIVPGRLLMTANGLIQGSYLIALILGPMVAGTVVELTSKLASVLIETTHGRLPVQALWELSGAQAAILFDSATFVVSAIIIGALRIPPTRNSHPAFAAQKNVWQDMRVGLNFIRHSKPLRRVLSVTAVATLGVGAMVLMAIPHLKERLKAGGLEYGGAISMLGVGSVLGGLIAARISRRLSANVLIGGMLVLAGAAIIAFAFAPNYIVVLFSVMLLGMSVVIARAALDTIAQALSPDDVRGRVQSAVNLIVAGGTALAEGFSAFLGHFWGVQEIFVAAGAVTVIAGGVAVYALRGVARAFHSAAV